MTLRANVPSASLSANTSNHSVALPASAPPDQPLPLSDISYVPPPDRQSSSWNLRVRFREHNDYVLPSAPSLVSEGDIVQTNSNNSSSSASIPKPVHKGDISVHEGKHAASTDHLGMPDLSNPDTIGLRQSSHPCKLRKLTSLFLLFGLMAISPALQPLSDLASVAQTSIAYLSNLTKMLTVQ